MKACYSSSERASVGGAGRKQREAYLPEYLFADQSIEIPCPRCHQTTPKTVDWIRANDRYACAGCNAQIVVDQDTLLAQRPKLL